MAQEGEEQMPGERDSTRESLLNVPEWNQSCEKSDAPAGNAGDVADAPGVDAEEWRSGYYQICPTYASHVCQPDAAYENAQKNANGHQLSGKSPLVLIGSGASLFADGGEWFQWRPEENTGRWKRIDAPFWSRAESLEPGDAFLTYLHRRM